MGADQSKPVLNYGKQLGNKTWNKGKKGCRRMLKECNCRRCSSVVETRNIGVQTNFSDDDDDDDDRENHDRDDDHLHNNENHDRDDDHLHSHENHDRDDDHSHNHENHDHDHEGKGKGIAVERESASEIGLIHPDELDISSNRGWGYDRVGYLDDYKHFYATKFNRRRNNINNIDYSQDREAFMSAYRKYYRHKLKKKSQRNNNNNNNNNNDANNNRTNRPSMVYEDSGHNNSHGYENTDNNNSDTNNRPRMVYDDSYNNSNNQNYGYGYYGNGNYNNSDFDQSYVQNQSSATAIYHGGSFYNNNGGSDSYEGYDSSTYKVVTQEESASDQYAHRFVNSFFGGW